MMIDERIEALTMHLEALTRVHEDFEKAVAVNTTEVRAAITDIRDVIRRLGNIATAHSIMLDDHEQRIEKLEE